MTSLVLGTLAIVLAGPVPWALGRVPELRRTPRAAMVLWQSVALAGVLAALGAGLSLVTAQLGDERSVRASALSVLPLCLTGLVLARLLLSGHRVGTRLRALRRRHRHLVDLVAADVDGVRVLEHEAPTAYCLPGLQSRVVVSRGTVASLTSAELAAVLAHERAHLRARHDLVLEAFTVLQEAFPAVVTSRRALDEVRLLVEVLADRAARRRHGAAEVVRAFATLAADGSPAAPESAIAAAGVGLAARLDLLLDEGPHRVQAAALLVTALAVLVLPTVLVVLPWLTALRR
ncbi:MAG TPA: M56 family metallopeptidase [Marmoricola sp.]|nr:M56 family metallopeptidase [Marmoricola sp.]